MRSIDVKLKTKQSELECKYTPHVSIIPGFIPLKLNLGDSVYD